MWQHLVACHTSLVNREASGRRNGCPAKVGHGPGCSGFACRTRCPGRMLRQNRGPPCRPKGRSLRLLHWSPGPTAILQAGRDPDAQGRLHLGRPSGRRQLSVRLRGCLPTINVSCEETGAGQSAHPVSRHEASSIDSRRHGNRLSKLAKKKRLFKTCINERFGQVRTQENAVVNGRVSPIVGPINREVQKSYLCPCGLVGR